MAKRVMSGRTSTSPKLYKDLYQTYYRESWRVARFILTILAIPCFLGGLYCYTHGMNNIYMVLFLWAGLVFVIYPRNAYRRPYKRALSENISIHFTFYADEMKEKLGGKVNVYRYDSLRCVIDAPGYFYFFHTKNDVSVLEKSGIIDGSATELSALLKAKVKKYKVQK